MRQGLRCARFRNRFVVHADVFVVVVLLSFSFSTMTVTRIGADRMMVGSIRDCNVHDCTWTAGYSTTRHVVILSYELQVQR
jgi:hypothetical protein